MILGEIPRRNYNYALDIHHNHNEPHFNVNTRKDTRPNYTLQSLVAFININSLEYLDKGSQLSAFCP